MIAPRVSAQYCRGRYFRSTHSPSWGRMLRQSCRCRLVFRVSRVSCAGRGPGCLWVLILRGASFGFSRLPVRPGLLSFMWGQQVFHSAPCARRGVSPLARARLAAAVRVTAVSGVCVRVCVFVQITLVFLPLNTTIKTTFAQNENASPAPRPRATPWCRAPAVLAACSPAPRSGWTAVRRWP